MNTQRRGPVAILHNALGEGLYDERRYTSPYSFTESTSFTGDDVAETVATGSADQEHQNLETWRSMPSLPSEDEAGFTDSAAKDDSEMESDREHLTTEIQHVFMTFRAWTSCLAIMDTLSNLSESIFWMWTQIILWILAALPYISRRVLNKTTLLWILAVLVGLVGLAVYGWVASVHASVYGWAGSVLHTGPCSICKASRRNFFRTACYPKDITADVMNTFNETYANFDTAMATRNLISTAPIDLRSSRSSLHRDLLRLRALNATLNIPSANFASIDSQTVNVLELSKAIPDVLFRFFSRLASTVAVVDYQTNVTIAEIAAFRAGKTSPYISIPGKRPRRVNAQHALSIRFEGHVLSWQKFMEPLLAVDKALLDTIGASIDTIEALSVSLETASNATYDSRVHVNSEWGLLKRSLYWLTGKEPPETKALLQTLSVTEEMKGPLHHLSTWFGPMWPIT